MSDPTITNAIPVVGRHLKHLETCLQHLYAQTLPPNEIIVIISEYTPHHEQLLQKIRNAHPSSIALIIQTFKDTKYAGKNRQVAYDLCSSDIIIYQDCDDLTHRQRNEILKGVFLKTNIPHILHGWTSNIQALQNTLVLDDIPLSSEINKITTHNGAAFMHKSGIGTLNFPDDRKGQDEKLTKFMSQHHKSVLLVCDDIYVYNNHLSSWS